MADRPILDAAALEDAGAFLHAAGLALGEISPTRVTGHIDLGADHHTPWGIVHGGVYTTAVESAASIGASAAARDRDMVAVGLSNTTHFLRAKKTGRVRLEATPLAQGRTHQLWRVDVVDDEDRLVAHGEVRLQNVPAG
jgi:1,4-dihydroxy-2-naphthoyl-CoA hydrolase